MSKYYDWRKTFNYDADITMVIGGRGIGKTYGLRRQFIEDYLKRGERFVCVCRTKESMSIIARGYFGKICEVDIDVSKAYEFKTNSAGAFLRRKTGSKDDKKQPWQQLGYFVAMSQFGLAKETTFEKVRRIVLDEGIIELIDRHHNYLRNEWYILSSIVNSCARETGETRKHKPNVYILGNACDLINPYFAECGIDDVPPYGKTWYRNKTFLLDYVKPDKKFEENAESNTVAGRMLKGTSQGAVYTSNKFANAEKTFVEDKPRSAKYTFTIVSAHDTWGVWLDKSQGKYYVTSNVPDDYETRAPVCAMTARDMRRDAISGQRVRKYLRSFFDLYGMSVVFFDSIKTRESFIKCFALFGIR